MSLDYHHRHHDRFLPAALEDQLIGFLARVAGLALLCAVAIAWLAILTWSSSDPSLMHATGGAISNWLGYFGATLSDLLLQTFGIASALVLLTPMFWSLELVLSQRVHAFGAKATYFPLAILILAGAFSSLPTIESWPLHHGYGGILGDAVYGLCASLVATAAPDRAGALTGLALFAVGTAAVAYSVGVGLTDITSVIKSRATRLAQRARREPSLTGLPQPHAAVQHARAWGEKLRDYSARAANAAHAHAQSYAMAGRAPRDPVGYDAPPFTHRDSDQPHPNHFEATHVAPVPARDHAPPIPHNQPQPHTARAPAPMPDEELPNDPVDRGTDFDGMTDAESRLIAQRFAPAGAQATAKPQPAPAPATTPQPTRGQAIEPATAQTAAPSEQPMLRGMTFNTSAPGYKRPSLNLLDRSAAKKPNAQLAKSVLRSSAKLLEEVLSDFGVKGEIRAIKPGPIVTTFELEPARGTKSSRVIGLADDIARSMSAKSARIAVVPGRNAIGIELPNARKEPILLRETLESEAFKMFSGTLPLALGKSITGEPVIADLASMPHLLVAGTTGSGKSVGVNAMIASLLYRFSPAECRLLMIDPKMLELSVYNGIPHLLTPVITDANEAVAALNWVVGEMEERNKRMAKLAVRNIDIYNNRVRNARKRGDMIARTVQTGFDRHTGQAIYEQQQMDMAPMPRIVVVIDEFADLMIASGKEVEAAVQRLAQMARAAGIHLIMATQRPSVDVITGTIKANFPTRISFKVASKVDSRTILNEQGAEQLLGQGDMLYAQSAGNAVRVHGPFVSDEEVEKIAGFLRDHHEPQYVVGITDIPASNTNERPEKNTGGGRVGKDRDAEALFAAAVEIVLNDRKASTSYLQRRLSIGYNRAADLIERMESEKIVGPAGPTGKREIFAKHPGSGAEN